MGMNAKPPSFQTTLRFYKGEFQNGKKKVAYSYRRKIEGQVRSVTTELYPSRQGEHGELEEFMMYVFIEK